MKRYVVTLEKEERDKLAGITRKGSHQSQKVLNALILLNCDEGEFNEHRAHGETIAEVLRIGARKVDRVKKRFAEQGVEAALGGRQGRRPGYVRKADGELEARLVALSCAELRRAAAGPLAVVAPVAGRPCRGTRPHRQCVARDGTPGSKENAIKPWRRARIGHARICGSRGWVTACGHPAMKVAEQRIGEELDRLFHERERTLQRLSATFRRVDLVDDMLLDADRNSSS